MIIRSLVCDNRQGLPATKPAGVHPSPYSGVLKNCHCLWLCVWFEDKEERKVNKKFYIVKGFDHTRFLPVC